MENTDIISSEPPELNLSVRIALWTCWLGASFALLAAAYVWFTRGQLAWITIVASFWALEMSYRVYRAERIKLRQPPSPSS